MGGNAIIFLAVAAGGIWVGATWARAQRALFDVQRTLNNLRVLRKRANVERLRLMMMFGGAAAILYLFVRGGR